VKMRKCTRSEGLILAVGLMSTASCASGPVIVEWHQTGPVEYGMDVPSLERAIGYPIMAPGSRAEDFCAMVPLTIGVQEVYVMIGGEQVVRIDVEEPGLLTREGVGVGDPIETVMAAYPDAIQTEHEYVDGFYLTVSAPFEDGPEIRFVFETDPTQVTGYRAGLLPSVGWIEGCS
jgi:hypothetical protein